MASKVVPSISVSLTGNGTASGQAPLTSTYGFYVGQQGFILSDNIASRAIRITDVQPTYVQVAFMPTEGLLAPVTYGGNDISAYTTAQNAKLFMPEQVVAIDRTAPQMLDGEGFESPQPSGTIVTADGTSKTNGSTTSPFLITPGSRVLLQADVAVYVRGVTASGSTVSNANGILVPAGKEWPLDLLPTEGFIACIPASGNTMSVKVWARPALRNAGQ